jgi:hypothetical protein
MTYLLCIISKIFYADTNAVFRYIVPNIQPLFHVLDKVKERIVKEASYKGPSIVAMVVKMKEKFQKYWDLSLLQICVPFVIDLRFKFNFIAFLLDAGFGDKGPICTEKVKKTMKDLFSTYSPMLPDVNNNSQSRRTNEIAYDKDD